MASNAFSSSALCQYVAKENEEDCAEEQYSLCPHCNLWLCVPHNLEHQQIIQTNAYALNDHVNQVRQQLTELSVDYLYEDCKTKIDEWKDQMHVEINVQHAEMLQQLAKLHNELTEEVTEFKTNKIDSFTREIVEPLTLMLTKQKQVHPKRLKIIETQMESVERKIEDIKNPDIIHINCDELKLDGQVNFIRKHPCDDTETTSKNHQSFELEVMNQRATHHFPLETRSTALAASAHFILVFEKPSTLLLFDKKTQLRSIQTEDKSVCHICWSDSMNLFLIAGGKLQTYDVITNNLVNILLDEPQENNDIWSVTCYFRNIFLLYYNDNIEHYLRPSFTRKKRWSKNEYFEKDSDSAVSCIRFNNSGMLAMSIRQKDFHWRIDLFDTHMQRIHRGSPLTNKAIDDLCSFQFISLPNHEWFAIDWDSNPRMLLSLDKNGAFKQQVQKNGSNLALMGNEFLVLRDSTGLHLYQLPSDG